MTELSRQVEFKTRRKIRAKGEKGYTIWQNVGLFGIVGWSVAVPTLLGVATGIYLDKHLSGSQSWTISGLLLGIILGCINAWYWVSKENRSIKKELEDDQ